MGIEWTQDLAVGISEVDDQHKELFARINHLLEACSQNKGKETLAETIKFLEEYVVYHFSCEERYMKTLNYPRLNEQQREHAAFVNKFTEIKEMMDADGAVTHIVIMTNRMVVSWLNDHIRKEDKKIGEFVKGNK